MAKFLKILLGSIFALAIVGNLIWIDLQLINRTEKETVLSEPVDLWTSKIEKLSARVTVLENRPVASASPVINQITQQVVNPTKTQVVTKTISTPKEFVISLGSGRVDVNDQWVDIYSAQASLNSANYPNIDKAYFEVVMHTVNGQGYIKAKLVESTIPFYYGEILQSQSGTGELVSTPFNLQSGNRIYRVQLNNQIGSAILDSARIRIVTK